MKSIKQQLVRGLLGHNIEVRKFPSVPFQPLSVFHLAVQFLMATRGRSLSFVQVGANDGRFGDPLAHYIKTCGWKGILIEPQPDVFELLVRNHAASAERLIFENVAVSDTSAEITLYTAPQNSATATYDKSVVSARPEVIARQLHLKQSELIPVKVPCLTLDALCARHGYGSFDLLQIDTEGHDLNVLRTIDLARIDVALIQFEHGHLDRSQCAAVAQLLASVDYEIYWGGHQADSVAMKKGVLVNPAPRP